AGRRAKGQRHAREVDSAYQLSSWLLQRVTRRCHASDTRPRAATEPPASGTTMSPSLRTISPSTSAERPCANDCDSDRRVPVLRTFVPRSHAFVRAANVEVVNVRER